jgi:hypothetical protein
MDACKGNPDCRAFDLHTSGDSAGCGYLKSAAGPVRLDPGFSSLRADGQPSPTLAPPPPPPPSPSPRPTPSPSPAPSPSPYGLLSATDIPGEHPQPCISERRFPGQGGRKGQGAALSMSAND